MSRDWSDLECVVRQPLATDGEVHLEKSGGSLVMKLGRWVGGLAEGVVILLQYCNTTQLVQGCILVRIMYGF